VGFAPYRPHPSRSPSTIHSNIIIAPVTVRILPVTASVRPRTGNPTNPDLKHPVIHRDGHFLSYGGQSMTRAKGSGYRSVWTRGIRGVYHAEKAGA
jgi:hypothetical protein